MWSGSSLSVVYACLVGAGAVLIVSLNISCLLTQPTTCGSGLSSAQLALIRSTNASHVAHLEQIAATHHNTQAINQQLHRELEHCQLTYNKSVSSLRGVEERLRETVSCPAPPVYAQKLLQAVRDQTLQQAVHADWYGHESDYLHQLMAKDHYRHNTVMSSIRPILTAYPASAWVTVADSVWGMNAGYIRKFIHANGGTVTATAPTNITIQHAYANRLIDEFSVQDAQQLSYHTHQFDFGLVKDGLRDMARPALAIYELLRVSRLGVVLIEAHDAPSPPPTAPPTLGPWAAPVEIPVDPLANLTLALLLRRYESGTSAADNVYKLSGRECVKIARSLNLPAVALKGLMDPDGTRSREEYDRLRAAQHAVVDNNLDPQQQWYHKIVCVLFNHQPDKPLLDDMRRDSYLVFELEQKSFA